MDYPQKFYEVLQYLKEHAGERWDSMPADIKASYDHWRPAIKEGEYDLTDGTGDMHNMPGLSCYGEMELQKNSKPQVVDDEVVKWSEAKPPAEWRKELGVSATTLRRHKKEGKLVVDPITPKLWRIQLASLRRYRGDE